MAAVPVFVGLDYSTEVVKVAVLELQGNVLARKPWHNDAARLDEFVRRFGTPVATGSPTPSKPNTPRTRASGGRLRRANSEQSAVAPDFLFISLARPCTA
jgi:hypothetical protein